MKRKVPTPKVPTPRQYLGGHHRPAGFGRQVPLNKGMGKDSKQEMLPHRHALSQLTGGDPLQRRMGNYAKATPGVGDESPSIYGMSPPGLIGL